MGADNAVVSPEENGYLNECGFPFHANPRHSRTNDHLFFHFKVKWQKEKATIL